MTAQQLLDMLRDARELQDKAFEQSVLEQLGVDVAYVRPTVTDGISSWWLRRPDVAHDVKRSYMRSRTSPAWRVSSDTVRLSHEAMQALYGSRYSQQFVAELANRPHPLFASLKKSPVERSTDDRVDALMYAYQYIKNRGER